MLGEDPHEGGLAGAVGPDQADPLAGAQLERHPVEDRLGAVVFLDAFNLKENHRDVWLDAENMEKVRETPQAKAAKSVCKNKLCELYRGGTECRL